MKRLPIVIYPEPVLLETAAPVTEFNDELKTLAEDMIYTMLIAPGAGLAAPQVGISKRLFVANSEYFGGDPESGFAVVNPVFTLTEGNELGEEGCLSLPEQYGDVERFQKIRVEAQNLDGEPVVYELEGFEARIFQHETDHLDGIMFFDRMTGLRKEMFHKRLRRFTRDAARKKK